MQLTKKNKWKNNKYFLIFVRRFMIRDFIYRLMILESITILINLQAILRRLILRLILNLNIHFLKNIFVLFSILLIIFFLIWYFRKVAWMILAFICNLNWSLLKNSPWLAIYLNKFRIISMLTIFNNFAFFCISNFNMWRFLSSTLRYSRSFLS